MSAHRFRSSALAGKTHTLLAVARWRGLTSAVENVGTNGSSGLNDRHLGLHHSGSVNGALRRRVRIGIAPLFHDWLDGARSSRCCCVAEIGVGELNAAAGIRIRRRIRKFYSSKSIPPSTIYT